MYCVLAAQPTWPSEAVAMQHSNVDRWPSLEAGAGGSCKAQAEEEKKEITAFWKVESSYYYYLLLLAGLVEACYNLAEESFRLMWQNTFMKSCKLQTFQHLLINDE